MVSNEEIKENIEENTQVEEDDVCGEEEYKQLSKLILELESKKGLIIKDASYGKSRVDYIKGKDLEKTITGNLDFVIERINKICGTKMNSTTQNVLQEIYEIFNSKYMLLKAKKQEGDTLKYPKRLEAFEEDEVEDCCGDKSHDKNKKKHSKHHNLSPEELAKFDNTMFYVLYIHRGQTRAYMWLGIAVVAVLLWCLLPVWPLELMLTIWWISFILLIFIVAIISIRLIFFTLFYIIGRSFWIFPDLFDEKVK